MSTEEIEEKLSHLIGEYRHAVRQVRDERVAYKQAKRQVKHATIAQKIVQEVAEDIQAQAHAGIASVVTRCLKSIFGKDAYEFDIKFLKKRGRTEAKLVFLKEGQEQDPKEASSGGQLDVASFALRLACIVLTKPSPRRLLVADEPFRNINGEEYQSRMGDLLLELAKEMDIQFVLASDDEWLKIGKVVNMEEE